MNWRTKKLLLNTMVFVVIWLLICAAAVLARSAINQTHLTLDSFISEWGELALFFLGYGALVTKSHPIVQNSIALIAIISMSILTTYFTINMLWRVDDVVLLPALFIEKLGKHDYRAEFVIANQGKRIGDLRLSFTAYRQVGDKQEQIGKSHEYAYPLLFKNSYWRITDDLKLGFFQDALYRLATTQKSENGKPNKAKSKKNADKFNKSSAALTNKVTIYMTLWFVDTQSGQECCNIYDYDASKIFLGAFKEKYLKPGLHKIKNAGFQGIKGEIKKNTLDPKHSQAYIDLMRFLGDPVKEFDLDRLRTVPQNESIIDIIKKTDEKLPQQIKVNSEGSSEEWIMFFYDYKNNPLDWTIYDDDDQMCLFIKLRVHSIEKLVLEIKSAGSAGHLHAFYRETLFPGENNVIKFEKTLADIRKESNSPNFSSIREINIIFDRKVNDSLMLVNGLVEIEIFGLSYTKEENGASVEN